MIRIARLLLLPALLAAALIPLAAQEESSSETAPAETPADAPADAGDESASPDDAASDGEAAESELPLLEEMELPTYDEFLQPTRRDWVILKDQRVLVVEPVYPRPNTLAEIQKERDTILDDRPRRFSEEGRQRLADLTFVDIFLPGEEGSQEFRIKIDDVQEIRHHEDLMLRRADQLVEAGDTRRAFELLFIVARIDPNWPGLEARQTSLLVADAGRWIAEGQLDRAFAMVAALYEHDPLPGGTERLFGELAEALIGGALDEERFREARWELDRLRRLDADHPAVSSWMNAFVERAKSLQAEAGQAAESGDDAEAAILIDKAAWAWPTLSGLRPVHTRLTNRYQRLLVGVPRLASDRPRVLPTFADERVARLTTADLFEVEGYEAVPAYRSDYFDRWEPTDLGRRARFVLRPTLPGWAARPGLTASDAIGILSGRLQADNPAHDARFADLVDSLQQSGPFAFEVVFTRIPLRAEAALARPRFLTMHADGPSHPAIDLFRRFREVERTSERVVYRRANPETAESGQRHLAEVVEIAHPSYEEAVRALDRGEVRMLIDVPLWDVPRLQEDERYAVKKLAVPATHLLQFHPESEAFQTAELRRAVAVSTDTARILNLVAGTGASGAARRVTAPYPSTHLGYDPLVAPRPVDLSLALALTLAAEKRFEGTIPPIVFVAPSAAPARQAAESLAATWKRIGLPVTLKTVDELDAGERWDVAYRTMTVADPVASLGSLITLDSAVNVDSLSDLPDWLRQRLLDLERAGDTATAQAILIDLHRLLHSDVRCVPLFETDRFLVTRGAVRGLAERPVAVYQYVERWVLPHEYPEERP